MKKNEARALTTQIAIKLLRTQPASVDIIWGGHLWRYRACYICETKYWQRRVDRAGARHDYCSSECRSAAAREFNRLRQARWMARVRLGVVGLPSRDRPVTSTTAEHRRRRTQQHNVRMKGHEYVNNANRNFEKKSNAR